MPLTKAEVLLDKERRANRPLSEMIGNEATPMINGYKIIKETPTYYKVPSTPLRDDGDSKCWLLWLANGALVQQAGEPVIVITC